VTGFSKQLFLLARQQGRLDLLQTVSKRYFQHLSTSEFTYTSNEMIGLQLPADLLCNSAVTRHTPRPNSFKSSKTKQSFDMNFWWFGSILERLRQSSCSSTDSCHTEVYFWASAVILVHPFACLCSLILIPASSAPDMLTYKT